MINRVDAKQSYIAPYDRAGRRTVHKDGDAPAFLLEQDEKGVIYEHGASGEAAREAERKKREQLYREKRAAKKEAEKRSAEFSAARPEERKSAEEKLQPKPEKTEGAAERSFDPGAFLKNIWGRVRAFFAGLVRNVWYGDEKTAETAEDDAGAKEQPQKQATVTREALPEKEEDPDRYSDARIRDLLAKKDEAGFMEALTQGHTRIPARNTSLLTYYDRRGRLVGPPPTDSTRILKGDGAGRSTIRRPQGNYRRFI